MEHYPTHRESQGPAADRVALIRLAWFIGLALLLALSGPQPLFAASFSAFLGVGAMALSLSAMILREPVWPPIPPAGTWRRCSICWVACSAGLSTVTPCASSCSCRAKPAESRRTRRGGGCARSFSRCWPACGR